MRFSSTRRSLSDLALGRPVAFAIVLIIVWWTILLLFASGLPRFSPSWLLDLRSTLVNLVALLVPLAVVAALGWWRQAGLALSRPDRSWWSLLPLLAFALSFAAGGLSGSPARFFSSVILSSWRSGSTRSCSTGASSNTPPTPSVRSAPSYGWRCCSALSTPVPGSSLGTRFTIRARR